MQDASATKSWLKRELTSVLGFGEVDEIVAYVTNTFHSKLEASKYLIELLGVPAARAEHISTRLFSTEPSPGAKAATATAPAGDHPKDGLVPRPTAVNSRLKSSKKLKKNTGATAQLLNNALIINCLRCGRIEYNGGRRCVFCDSELHYEADAAMSDHGAQQHMEELVQLDETGAERTRVLDAEQFFYDEDQVGEQDYDDTRSTNAKRPITMALDLDKNQFADVRIARNEQLTKHESELVDRVQRKMSKGKRGNGRSHSLTEVSPASSGSIRREPVGVVDDSYNLLYV
uniref:Zinc finger C2HC5-type domain-containing protein n=1 Tax=Peronospora matthiolae TaxID=2874970 RepID=A0AAV1UNK7_9STRA